MVTRYKRSRRGLQVSERERERGLQVSEREEKQKEVRKRDEGESYFMGTTKKAGKRCHLDVS